METTAALVLKGWTMKPKTPEQLKRLNIESAELMGWVKTLYPMPGTSNPYVDNHQSPPNGHKDMHTGAWNPCGKNSAQAQNYLIPRLKARGLDVHVFHIGDGASIEIHRPLTKGSSQMYIYVDGSCESDDDINACIVECFVEAMKKLKDQS